MAETIRQWAFDAVEHMQHRTPDVRIVLNRYEVIKPNGNRAIIDADNLAHLEQLLQKMDIKWASIRRYESMFRATI